MTEQDDQIDSIFDQMQSFLKSQARKEITPSHPIYLKTQYKNSLRVIDSQKNVFNVDQIFLNSFRDVYTDKTFKLVRLQDWAFELQFLGKKCKKISLLSETVIFSGGKGHKKEITGTFKVEIAGADDIANLSAPLRGYLNRLAKRNLLEQSDNVALQMKSLLSFAHVAPKQTPKFLYNAWSYNRSSNYVEPLSTLNPEGRKVLERLRHFVSREQIYEFIVNQQVSEEAVRELKKVLKPQKEKKERS